MCEDFFQFFFRKLRGGECFADALEQDQSQAALFDFLVQAHQLQTAPDAKPRRLLRKFCAHETANNTVALTSTGPPHLFSHRAGNQKAGAPRLAMQPGAKPGTCLYCMTKGVAEIQ